MFALITLLIACGEKSTDTSSTDEFIPAGQFILQSSEGFQPLQGDDVYLSFLNGDTIDFSASCNSFGGPFEIVDGHLEVGELARTDMGCDQASMDQDDWLAEFFTTSPMVQEAEQGVLLSGGESSLTFVERQ